MVGPKASGQPSHREPEAGDGAIMHRSTRQLVDLPFVSPPKYFDSSPQTGIKPRRINQVVEVAEIRPHDVSEGVAFVPPAGEHNLQGIIDRDRGHGGSSS